MNKLKISLYKIKIPVFIGKSKNLKTLTKIIEKIKFKNMENFRMTPEELADFRLTPEARVDAMQRQCERVTEYLNDLRKQLQEAEIELKKFTDMGFHANKPKENTILEVTTYRQPIPKKNYEYIEHKIGSVIGIDKDHKEVLWEGFTKRPTFEEMKKMFIEPSNDLTE
jgi:hypothetical protein